MKILAIALCFLGIWFLWSALMIDADSHHEGSVLRLLERFDQQKKGSDALGSQFKLDQAINEGKHGYALLGHALTLLALSGCSLLVTSGVTLFFSRKSPNQPMHGTKP